jgi:hypothetical protein
VDDPGELEGVARDVHEKHGFDDPPVDAFDLADALEAEIEWVDGHKAWRFQRRIYLPRGTHRPARIHSFIVHELAHILLDDYGIEQSERAARYLGAALLVSRRTLDRQLRRGWDLWELMGLHVNASGELLARRITDVREASLSVYDNGRFRYRVGHRGIKPTLERELVAEALESRSAVRLDDLSGAWPLIDGDWYRVLVLHAA